MSGGRAADGGRLLSPRTAALLVACVVALFALSFLLRDKGPSVRPERVRTGAGTYSASAIGHAAFYGFLDESGVPVERGLGNALAQVGKEGTLIVVEPDVSQMLLGDGLTLLDAPRLLLVLPKWIGTRDPQQPSWVSAVAPQPLHRPTETLALVSLGPDLVYRTERPQGAAWGTNEIGVEPEIPGVVQLIRSNVLRPVVGGPDGMLVAEAVTEKGRVWVLADPDVMSNHGIGRGENARFMYALVRALREWDGGGAENAPVVFDETVHGYRKPEASAFDLLFRFPYAIVVAVVVGTALVWVWAGARRFGAPLPPRRVLDFGKENLIGNGARMLDYAGHHAVVTRRYIRAAVQDAAERLHLPPRLGEAEMARNLDRIARARGVGGSCVEILSRADDLVEQVARGGAGKREKERLNELFGCARDIYRWKGALLNGSATDRRHI